MKDAQCVEFLQWALPHLRMRWPGFRKVRRQVCKRIGRRMRELGLSDVSEYCDFLENWPEEWKVLDSFCRISISRFYRDRGVFDFLRATVLPELVQESIESGRRELQFWIAGCASGEEVYTLNIIWMLELQAQFPDLRLRLVTTDADETMLARARRGSYPSSSLNDFPQQWMDVAFTQDGDEYRIDDSFRRDIDFRLEDIRCSMPEGPFDLIACRHLVFTYFDEAWQRELLNQMLQRLLPHGIFITGKQEPLPAGVSALNACGKNMGVFRKCAPTQYSTIVKSQIKKHKSKIP